MINLEIYNKWVIIINKNRNPLQNKHVVEINNGNSFYTLYAWRQLYRDSCSINGKMRAGGAASRALWRELYSKRSFIYPVFGVRSKGEINDLLSSIPYS